MENRKIDWVLHRVADCAFLDTTTRDAAKLAAHTLANIRNMLGVSAQAEPADIQEALYKLLNP